MSLLGRRRQSPAWSIIVPFILPVLEEQRVARFPKIAETGRGGKNAEQNEQACRDGSCEPETQALHTQTRGILWDYCFRKHVVGDGLPACLGAKLCWRQFMRL